MDEPWMIERLEWWIATARAARITGVSSGRRTVYGFMYDSSDSYLEMRERSAQTRSVIARVLGSNDLPSLMRRRDNAYWVDEGIEFAEHALAILRTRAETHEKLGTNAPTMKADALHSLIWDAASLRWESGHYTDAVQRAATALSGHVKDLTGRYELGDNELMTQAFSLSAPQAGKPRLRWPGKDDDLTVKAMRIGILNTAQGVFSAIRNPATHTTDELPKQEALEQLASLSVLARWIDRCELVRVEAA
ncbi:hypothetical protein ABIE18_004438 [Arthrobacter sp. 2762]